MGTRVMARRSTATSKISCCPHGHAGCGAVAPHPIESVELPPWARGLWLRFIGHREFSESARTAYKEKTMQTTLHNMLILLPVTDPAREVAL